MASDRGHLKVFIGMAPGVGKTYRMLQEGAAEAENGRDAIVGYLESHGRAETVAQAEGLEIVPRRTVVYRGTPLEEMDLPAVLARKPELCLIDELAHTNAPGVEHEKRYEDVREVIEAGIDVFSTVNVQHLESLNDQITQLTGSITRETIPDEVLSMADEIVLIDLTPEALIARLKAGKVYRPERVQAALNNFFKIENLAALRETALRQVAEDVEVKRLLRSPASERTAPASPRDEERLRGEEAGLRTPAATPQAIAERLLALATLELHSERVVRRAWRSAQRLDAVLDVLVVRPASRAPSPEDRKRLEALRRLCAMLGVRLHVEEGDDVAVVAIRLARSLGSTYVLLGAPSPPKGLRRFGGSPDRALPMRLLRGLPGVDIRIIADPSLRGEAGEEELAGSGRSGEATERQPAGEAVTGGAGAEGAAEAGESPG